MIYGVTGHDELLEFTMLVAISMATLSALGVAFYVRFLFALCKECIHHRICCVVCMRVESPEHVLSDDRILDTSLRRTA